MKDGRKAGIGLALAAVIAGAILLTRKARQISLSAGWNEVIYTGGRQTAGVAMQSITPYLEIAYYYDQLAGIWRVVVYDTILEPGMILNIKVTQDSIWTF